MVNVGGANTYEVPLYFKVGWTYPPVPPVAAPLIMTTTTKNTRVKVPNKTLPSTETVSKEKYDGSTPNTKGKVDTEKRVGAMAKLLKCKQYIIISTINVRTIREEHKQIKLKYNCEYHNIDILGI